jgi:xanthine dehydrogenase accessory factor
MKAWPELARAALTAGQPCALLTVTRTDGSTPREAGARMLICGDAQHGTIGGGKLEHDATDRAHTLLAMRQPGELAVAQVYNLGATLGQCCGGRVEVLVQRLGRAALPFLERLIELDARRERYAGVLVLEPCAAGGISVVHRIVVSPQSSTGVRAGDALDALAVAEARRALLEAGSFVAPRWLELDDRPARVLLEPERARGLPLVVFGAGHVGRALVHVLGPLGWPITWVETRDDAFPRDLPSGVESIATDVPEACIDDAPAHSAFLIMTHDHALDLQLCERVLARADFVYCGLIGSRTKRSKFVHRLAARGFDADAIDRITCPIGLPQLSGKAPFEVAIATAAQLLLVANGERTR